MLKKSLLLLTISLLVLQTTHAQKLNTDSLWRVFETTNNDSIRLQTINTLTFFYISIEIDSNFYYSKRLIKTCEKLNTPRYLALGILYSSYVYYRIGDYKTVQEHIAKAATIAEQNGDGEVLARIENYRQLIETDPYKKIEHLRKAIQFKKAFITYDQVSTTYLGSLSAAFLTTNQVDSALFYAQKAYESSIKTNDTLSSFVMAAMGNVYLKMNQTEIAYAFYRRGIKAAIATQKIGDLMRAYMPMANYFNNMNQPDSALYYWKKPFEYGPKEVYTTKLSASKKIYDYYFKKGNNDSAAKYMNFYITANDSINSTNKVAQLQAAKFEDELRQQEQEKAKAEDNENRHHNIQLAITAIGILSAVILFLLLSRSIIVSHKLIEILGVIVLLVVFEFINLLIHPFLENITHHSPALMLLALVAIAALIVPLHHRLEHWTTQKLVEKNKAIRLANAKKTIEELEAPTN